MNENKMEKLLTWVAILVVVIGAIILGIFYLKLDDTGFNNFFKKEETKIVLNGELAYDLLRLENNETNTLFSPLSINYILNMIMDGCENETDSYKELYSLINGTTLDTVNNIKDRLTLANSIFIKDTYKDDIKQSYIDLLNSKYNSNVYYDEFKSATSINNWVKENTMNQIDKVLDDSYFMNPLLTMILVNALAMDMEWNQEFIPSDTIPGNFSENLTVNMMKNTYEDNSTKYYQDENITAVKLDLKKYDNEQFEYLAIMPNNLKEYLNNFNNDTYQNIYNNLNNIKENKKLNVLIPRYSYQYDLNLKKDLNTLGVNGIFDSSDLTSISDKSLKVADVIHKTNIDFSEKGIKAAAVTAATFKAGAMPETKKITVLEFNKPFMYFIINKNTGNIWFVGTLYTPELVK